MPTERQLADFNSYARNPKTWILGAQRQLAVAELLFNRAAALQAQSTKHFEEFTGCSYASYMHAGFAIENAVKAVLIANDSTIVLPTGCLDTKKLGPKSGHSLQFLVGSVLLDLDEEDRNLLLKLEEHTIWAGRYTVPIRAAVLYDDATMRVLGFSPVDERERIKSLFARLIDLTT